MPLEDFLDHQATISVEAPDGQVVGQDTLGGADRSGTWPTVAAGVPCMVHEKGSSLDYDRNDSRTNVILARIYFAADPCPNGMSTRHRITVTKLRGQDPVLIGVYAVQGVIDPNFEGELFEVDCERIRTP